MYEHMYENLSKYFCMYLKIIKYYNCIFHYFRAYPHCTLIQGTDISDKWTDKAIYRCRYALKKGQKLT